MPLFAAARRSELLSALINEFNSGKLRIYSGTRPATADSALSGNTLLAELTINSTSFTESGGLLTANAVTSDSSADATGTASFARVYQSDGTTPIVDLSVGVGSGEFQLNSLSFGTGALVACTGFTIRFGDDPQPLGVAGTWVLAFNDEFNGSTVDTSKWILGGSLEDPGNVFDFGTWTPDPANVSVSGGVLTLAVTSGSPSHGGGVATSGLVSFGHGYTEIRARCPGTGGWPAGWLYSPTVIEEIDIFEGAAWNATPSIIIHATHTTYIPDVKEEFTGTSDGANWHIYGYNSNNGKFYIDGVESADSTTSFAFPGNHYGLLTNASYSGSDTGTMDIDYWRFWTGS